MFEKVGRYRYVILPDKVIAITTFAGKDIRGVAKCAPNDTFDEEIGKELARRRCDVKVARKRVKRAESKMRSIQKAADELYNKVYDTEEYYFNSEADYQNAVDDLYTFESRIRG